MERPAEAAPLLAAAERPVPVDAGFFAALPPLFLAVAVFARPLLDLAVERAVDERPLVLPDDDELPPDELPSSVVQRPESTRCAASATASAMIEPSLVALDTAAVAALLAESAASRPASRILRRAAGLALIAAAAAASPAASISRLIATFATLSTVVSLDLDDDLLPDLAMSTSLFR